MHTQPYKNLIITTVIISMIILTGCLLYYFQDNRTNIPSALGPVIIDLEEKELMPIEETLLRHPNVGGVVLFTRNYESKDQLKKLIQNIRKARPNIIILVDNEGGNIQRLRGFGFSALPAPRVYGELYNINPDAAFALAKKYGNIMATELLECDIDLSLMPILDLNKTNVVIGGLDRAFHSDPKVVVSIASAFIEGMKSAGMATIGKHFPGHGSCEGDTHIVQPQCLENYDELKEADLYPFIKLIEENKLTAIMPSHLIFPAIDKDNRVSFSKIWLQTILRNDLKFQGVIMSDCLAMKGAEVTGGTIAAAQIALDAGCDMIILSKEPRDNLLKILDTLKYKSSEEKNSRINTLRKH